MADVFDVKPQPLTFKIFSLNVYNSGSYLKITFNKYLATIPQRVIVDFDVSIQISLTFGTVVAFRFGTGKWAQFTVTIVDVSSK